jgi:hypothetical protein
MIAMITDPIRIKSRTPRAYPSWLVRMLRNQARWTRPLSGSLRISRTYAWFSFARATPMATIESRIPTPTTK